MPFDLDALQERLGGPRITEVFTEEMASAEAFSSQLLSVESINRLFPGVALSDTEHIAYVPTRMCHSLPTINRRGRCFFPQVIHRSAPSANDQLVDLDHILKRNQYGQDKVIGHIKAIRFDPEGLWNPSLQLANTPVIPSKAIPLYALMALFRRTEDGNDIVQQCLKNRRKWKSSMECVADLPDCGFLYEGQYIDFANAEPEMIQCVEKMRVRPYKGKKLSLCLGGMDRTVDFCGVGITPSPADGDCEVMGLVTRRLRESASDRSTMAIRVVSLSFPQEKNPEEAIELASEKMESLLEEEAAIQVIGQTEPGGLDGHVHDVLSNMMILAAGGHTHRIQESQLVTGSAPRFTGITTESEIYTGEQPTQGAPRWVAHNHLINIPLKGKRNSPSASSGEGDAQAASSGASQQEEVFTFEEAMKIDTRLQALETALQKIITSGTAGNNGSGGQNVELASALSEVQKIVREGEVANAIREGVQTELANKKYVTSEDHEKALEAAKKEARKEAEAEFKQKEERMLKTNDRLGRLTKLGIDVDATEEGKTKTIREIVAAIDSDDHFNSEYERHQTKVELLKKLNEKEQQQQQVTTQEASTPRPYLLSGSSGNGGSGGSRGGNSGGNGGSGGGSRLPSHFATRGTIGRR